MEDDLKGILDGFRREWVERVKNGLLGLIESRELSVHNYEALTDFEFASNEDLYTYLRKVWDYVLLN